MGWLRESALMLAIAAVSGVAVGALAATQEPAKPSEPAPTEAPKTRPAPSPATTTPPSAQPSAGGPLNLDELLGLTKPVVKPDDAPAPNDAKPVTTPGDVTRAKLDELLKGGEQGDEFEQAVALMNHSARRLGEPGGVGVETQRLQEDAIRRLDQLLAKAQQQQQKQRKKSSSKPSENDQQQQEQQQPSQSQGEGEQDGRTSNNPASTANAPGLRTGDLRPALESARAAWGNLPERVRASLMQGAGDRFSREYQRLTEEYYKRLGEQAE